MTSQEIETYADFTEMGLKKELIRGIMAYGFEYPSDIQQKAIVPFTRGIDMIAQAQSGTGKTATFSIAALQNVDANVKEVQCLIISHTHELATQSHIVISTIGKNIPELNISLVLGGDRIDKNADEIHRKRPQIIVGTPGRILHLLNDGYINPNSIQWVIMDEADNLLAEDFKQQVYEIYQFLPKSIHTGLYTATVTPEMEETTKYFMKEPVTRIFVKREMLSLEGIKQFYIDMESDRDKFPVLMDIYSKINIYQLIIYCNQKKQADILKRKLTMNDLPAECLHGQLTPKERSETMAKFRAGTYRVLITTDVLARGIDVQQVGLVVNYDFPRDISNYLHRIGRTGRYGRKGCAINFITRQDRMYARDTETFYHTHFMELPADVESALTHN